MELKIFIFSILLSGSSISRTIIYNNHECLIIDDYLVDSIGTEKASSTTKVSYYEINAENVIELVDDKISFVPKKRYAENAWESKGVVDENWLEDTIQEMDEEHIQIFKRNTLRSEETLLRKVDVNNHLSKAMPFIMEYQGELYISVNSFAMYRDRKVFNLELLSSRLANDEECETFKKHKKILNK